MKTKLLIIVAILLLQENFLFSQCISIELSITYDKEYHIFKKKSKVKTPKLNIIYRNNCDSNYYFLKVYDSEDGLPYFMCMLIFESSSFEKPDYHKLMNYNAKSYSSQNFNVEINNWHGYGGYWEANIDTVDVSKTYSSDVINCRLNGFSDYIRLDNDPDYHVKSLKQKYWFDPSDVLPENILSSVKDQFVFLKSGDTFTDTYNLVAFQILEGCYTFIIVQEDIKNNVQTVFYDSKIEKYVNQELELPVVVGEYQLYSGAFNTNKVKVCFGDK
jgi:hypothetical protein